MTAGYMHYSNKTWTNYSQLCKLLRRGSCPATAFDRVKSFWEFVSIVISLKEFSATAQCHLREQKETRVAACIGPTVVSTLAGHVSKIDAFSKLLGKRKLLWLINLGFCHHSSIICTIITFFISKTVIM